MSVEKSNKSDIEKAKEIMKKNRNRKRSKEIAKRGIIFFFTLIVIVSVVNFSLKKIEREKTIKTGINELREANLNEKKMLFTYLIKINEKNILKKDEFVGVIKESSFKRMNNGDVYISTELTRYKAFEIIKGLESNRIINVGTAVVLYPMLKLGGEK